MSIFIQVNLPSFSLSTLNLQSIYHLHKRTRPNHYKRTNLVMEGRMAEGRISFTQRSNNVFNQEQELPLYVWIIMRGMAKKNCQFICVAQRWEV